MSIASQISRLNKAKEDIAASIERKGVSVPADLRIDGYPALIDNISAGGESDDVCFYDYDGTLLHSYGKDRFLAMTALPDNPVHEGFVAQGWNYTLAQAQEYVSKYGCLSIGQNYDTPDGATEIDIVTPDSGQVSLSLSQSEANGLSVDWGDGTVDRIETAGSVTFNHTYAELGAKTIRV